jgi:hypothetical protein
MIRRPFTALSISLLAAFVAATHPRADAPPRATFVELDALALDKDDRPVRGLQARDFAVKEDGRPVQIATFSEVSAAGISGRDDARSVVLLLDDMLSPIATTVVRGIASRFLDRARPYDQIDVVRLTHKDDELAGRVTDALDRVGAFRGGALSYFGRSPVDDMLQTLARVSRSLQSMPHRRKVIACIGSRDVCDPFLPVPSDSLIWKSWRDAISEAAAANASLYVVDVAGVRSAIDLGMGVVDITGGEDFVRSNDFNRAAELIFEQASHYYLLGYTPVGKSRELHDIHVSIARPGVHALARQTRGD